MAEFELLRQGADAATEDAKFIHLLYAPTNFCNMSCQYCYLGTGTDEATDTSKAVETLKYSLKKLLTHNIIPFNLSLHGGEATAIPHTTLIRLLEEIEAYYSKMGPAIKAAGYPLNPLHIKTNLFNFDKLYDVFVRFKVSISGSVDLPFSLHEKYRVDKRGKSTLKRIMKNIALLARYPHHKKISCVMTREHLAYLDEFISDIKTLHYDIGLDMSRFNIMFGFDSDKNSEKFDGKVEGTDMLNGEEHLEIYRRLKKAFTNTDLEPGLREHWFKEFTPEFCCSAVNCGDKFFLLQSNGDVYACPRGQASTSFLYGNVFKHEPRKILESGWKTIEVLENNRAPSEECYQCEYLPHCHQGCIFVREETGLQKSYTCELQKAIYKDNPKKYPAFDKDYIQAYAKRYQFRNNVQALEIMDSKDLKVSQKSHNHSAELYEPKNSLAEIIARDASLRALYSNTAFRLRVDEREYALCSTLLSHRRQLLTLSKNSKVALYIEKSIFLQETEEPVNNNLLMMLLRNTLVRYGDEQREKQEHIIDHALYYQSLMHISNDVDAEANFVRIDLSELLLQWSVHFVEGVRNNLFFTTKALREYHYRKQQKNAFYHIQAINLPFPFFEFYWLDD